MDPAADLKTRSVLQGISGHARRSTCRPFRGSCRPAKVTVCSRPAASTTEGMRTPFAGPRNAPGSHCAAESRARSETAMRSSILPARKPQAGIPSFIQPSSPDAWWVTTIGEVAIASTEMHVTGVIGSCRWSTSKRSLPEHAPDAANRPGAEDDVRERAVRRHDHGTADRNDIRRRVAVAPDPRVQRTRELARRVVAHHQPHLVPARLQRLRLQLGMLDNRAPERPRERHHDADLHGGIVFTRRRHRGRLAPRRPARRRSSFSSKRSRKPSCTPAR